MHLLHVYLLHWWIYLSPIAAWILVSGLDDLFITLIYLWNCGRAFAWPLRSDMERAPERRIAIMVPLWREYTVIGRMLERNLSTIQYSNYDVFVGVYPNDEPTARAVRDVARSHPRVHAVTCPHDGPTSKGDCLNWIHEGLKAYETRHGVRFEVIITHDAEDLIHPESLRYINWFSAAYDMVQVPVLPLPTRLREFTHGLYCDEFAEYQSKDIPVRVRLGGFLPSNGVGTGFGRVALERLAAERGGRLFDPDCLTEDYENGFGLHSLGYSQIFVPLRFESGVPVATREYFPRNAGAAIRQRSRWVSGIALQGWQRHGWRGSWRQVYWFWRDRKGLVGNLLTPVANAIFLYGLARIWTGAKWPEGMNLPHWAVFPSALTLIIMAVQAAIRIRCCARVYGWAFAAAAPARMLWGNLVNSVATIKALHQFVSANRKRRVQAWLKTEHDYPKGPSEQARPLIGEVLVRTHALSTGDLDEALRTCPPGRRLGEHLVISRKLSEQDVYHALSSQAGIPLGPPAPSEVDRRATRLLPAATARRWHVMPYRIVVGQLHVVTIEVPDPSLTRALSALSGLELHFRLVEREDFEALAKKYLPGGHARSQ